MAAGFLCATSSISMPPAELAMITELDGTVHQNAEIEFALDIEAFFNQQPTHDAAAGTGLRRDQRSFPESLQASSAASSADAPTSRHRLCRGPRREFAPLPRQRRGDFWATSRASSAAGHHLTARRGNAEAAKNLFSLILVNFICDMSWVRPFRFMTDRFMTDG